MEGFLRRWGRAGGKHRKAEKSGLGADPNLPSPGMRRVVGELISQVSVRRGKNGGLAKKRGWG